MKLIADFFRWLGLYRLADKLDPPPTDNVGGPDGGGSGGPP